MKTNKLALLALSAVIASAAACGSDSTPAKTDGPRDGSRDTMVTPNQDTNPSPGPEAGGGAEVAAEVPKPDATLDVPKDIAPPDMAIDMAPPDGGSDVKLDVALDTPGLDGPDAGVGLDVGADTADATPDTGPAPCAPLGATCAPVLGAQIDRLGRAGVNTALTDPFWDDGTQTLADHKVKQDKYNQASNPATWGDVELATGKKTKDLIKGALAAYDALDGTSNGAMTGDGCGTQLAFGATYKGTTYPDYTLLTTVLTDDRLYVNTNSGTCATYLALEANELGIANADCGGRTPTYNTIDITYSALATGTAVCTTACPVSSGVTVDADRGANYSEATFPFLGDPLP